MIDLKGIWITLGEGVVLELNDGIVFRTYEETKGDIVVYRHKPLDICPYYSRKVMEEFKWITIQI